MTVVCTRVAFWTESGRGRSLKCRLRSLDWNGLRRTVSKHSLLLRGCKVFGVRFQACTNTHKHKYAHILKHTQTYTHRRKLCLTAIALIGSESTYQTAGTCRA